MSGSRRRRKPANDNLVPPAPTSAAVEDCQGSDIAQPVVGDLNLAGQLLTWGVRNWVKAFKVEESFAEATGGAFERFGLAGAAKSLDQAMMLLAASAARMIDIRCVACRYLSPDEAILLEAAAAAQSEGHFLATAALRKLMPGTAARLALPHVIELARELRSQGLVVQPLSAAPQQAATTSLAVPASRLLH